MPCFLNAQVDAIKYEISDTLQAVQFLDAANKLTGERKFEEAVEQIDKAKSIYSFLFDDKSKEVANCWYLMGYNHYYKRNLDLAIEHLSRALPLQIQLFGENSEVVVKTCNLIALSYKRKGAFSQAFLFHERAKNIWVNLSDDEENEKVAISFDRLGKVVRDNGDYDLAIQYFNKALDIRWRIHGKETGYIANGYYEMGLCYTIKGDYAKANEYQTKALNFWLDRNMPDFEDNGYYFFEIAKNYRQLGDYEKAIEHYKATYEFYSKYDYLKLNSKSSYLASLGSIFFLQQEYKKAIAYQDSAIQILLENFGPSMHHRVAYSHHQKGLNYMQIGNYEEAIKEFDESLKFIHFNSVDSLHQINAYSQLIHSLTYKGEVFRKWYLESNGVEHLYNAKEVYNILGKVVKYQRENLSEGSKTLLSKFARPGYTGAMATNRFLFEHTNDSKHLVDAFDLLEKSHSLALFETMKHSDAMHHSGIPDSLLTTEKALQIDVTYYEKQRQGKIAAGAKETSPEVLSISNKLFNLKRDYEDLKKQFENKYPDYYQLKYNLNTVKIEYIQKELLTSNQALIEYFVSDSLMYTFAILKDTFYLNEIKKDFPLEDWVGEMLHGIYDPFTVGGDDAECAEKYTRASHQIYDKIFRPVDELIPDKTELIIVPDGVLGYVPFDALLVKQPENAQGFNSHHYLLKDHQISYAYSATLLKEMRYRKHRKEPKKNILAFAPSFGEVDTALLATRYIDVSNNRNLLSPLQYNDDEVRAIDSLVGADVYLDSMATEDRFTALAQDYRILHLSTHGKANDKVGDYSFLAFYEQDDSLENEWLYNRELYNLRLNADMVVLSACETGIGELQRGEGIISLARGFSYAGAKSIITTLWSVNDRSTQKLMQNFYGHLKSGKSKDAALRQAKLDYLQNSPNFGQEPFFWAGIIPVGDMSPVELSSGWGNWWVYCLGVVALLFLIAKYFRKK